MVGVCYKRQSATGDITGLSFLLSPFSVVPPARNDLFIDMRSVLFSILAREHHYNF